MKQLKEIREFLNKIPNINAGGCGISTLSMYLYAKKKLNKKFDIFDINFGDHFVLGYKDNDEMIYFDCSKIRPTRFEFRKIISLDELILYVNDPDFWNTDFDRKYIKSIDKKFKLGLSKIIKN